MGLTIKGKFETEKGAASSVYLRVETITFKKIDSSFRCATTLWPSKSATSKVHNSIPSHVIYYNEENPEGLELEIPNMYVFDIFETHEIEEPVYEIQDVEEQVPYVSFDENGDEVTKYRTILKEEKVQVGEELIKKQVTNLDLVQQNLFETVYKKIEEKLTEIFPKESIEHD